MENETPNTYRVGQRVEYLAAQREWIAGVITSATIEDGREVYGVALDAGAHRSRWGYVEQFRAVSA